MPIADARPAESRPALDEHRLHARLSEILNRHPAVGLALGVIRGGGLEFFYRHGLADIASGTPINADTAFRIGSVTKLFTAVAVMQLWERGLVDLDVPASEYLRSYRLLLGDPTFRPVTLRHLLTHTSGIPDVRHPFNLLHFNWGPFEGRPPLHSVPVGEPMPTLAEYYRGGLRSVVGPGTTFAYSNHGFATLGQIVEDVSGSSLDRYLREHVFNPLGMDASDVRRSPRVAERLATGYVLRRRGPEPVPDRDWIGAGGGGIYSTTRDIARFAAFLLGSGGVGSSVLRPETLATMLKPQWRTDERVTEMGIAFFLSTVGGRRLAGHEGILPGFNSQLLIAPEDDIGVVAFTNGSTGAMSWLPAAVAGLVLDILKVPEPRARNDIAHRPDVWPDLCGRYRLPPRISDLRGRMAMGRGAEVYVDGGRLMVRLLTPIPALRRGFALHPDDATDPLVFRVEPFGSGMPTFRVVFARGRDGEVRAAHTDLGWQPISLVRSPTRRPHDSRLAAPAEARPAMIERLSSADRLVLGADSIWPQDVGALAILDGERLLDRAGALRIGEFRDALARRLHVVPRFRQRVVRPRRGLGGPVWVDDVAFRLGDHVKVHPLPARSGDEAFLRAAETIRRQRLDPTRPLWEAWLLPGLSGDRVGLFLRFHHVIGDGRAALSMLAALVDVTPSAVTEEPPPWLPKPSPSGRALLADNLRHRLAALAAGLRALARPPSLLRNLRAALPGTRELMAEPPGDETSVNRVIGPHRRFAIVRDSLHDVRAIGRANGATVNDVLLAATAAGLRALLIHRGESIANVTLRILVPVSLRGRLRGVAAGNRISQLVVPLPLGTSDPVKRLRAIAAETTVRKGRTHSPPTLLFRFGIVRRLVLKAIVGQRVNVTSASLTGPRHPLYLAGARVLDLFPMLNLIGNQPIGVGAISYAGSFEICITADGDAVPDVDVVAAGIRDELEALRVNTSHSVAEDASRARGREAAGVSGQAGYRRSRMSSSVPASTQSPSSGCPARVSS